MNFLPQFSSSVNPFVLFGLTVLLGLIGGEVALRTRILPRISGYILVGILVGPHGLDLVNLSLLASSRLFVDISIGLVLFSLGRHLDFSWFQKDPGLLLMGFAESALTFSFVFLVLTLFNLPWLPAALAATIAMATSPAVVMMIAQDLTSEGPVTRRTLILTSLNNLFALTLFTLLLPMTSSEQVLPHIAYRLFGSISLGIIVCTVMKAIAYLIGKRKENQFVLFVGAIVLVIGLTRSLNLSSMLAVFSLGLVARNFDSKHLLTEVDFGWLARLFFILLFVIIGVYLRFTGLWQVLGVVLILLLVRLAGKILGIWAFSNKGRLTKTQAITIALALSPMAEVAIGMSNTLTDFNPDLGRSLTTIIAAVVAIMHLLGPVATQIAFLKSGEALDQTISWRLWR